MRDRNDWVSNRPRSRAYGDSHDCSLKVLVPLRTNLAFQKAPARGCANQRDSRAFRETIYADHIERDAIELFRLTCERDLEDIVAQLKHGCYGEGWYKMRSPRYSQREGRRALFERKRTATA